MNQMRWYFQRLPWKKDFQLINLFEKILLKGRATLLFVLLLRMKQLISYNWLVQNGF